MQSNARAIAPPPTNGVTAGARAGHQVAGHQSARRPGHPGYSLFDVDLHTSFRRAADLLPYLPQRYQQRFRETSVGDSPATYLSGAGGNREDATAPDGSPAG